VKPYIKLKPVDRLSLIFLDYYQLSFKFWLELGSLGEMKIAIYDYLTREWKVDDKSFAEYMRKYLEYDDNVFENFDLMFETFCHNVVASSERILKSEKNSFNEESWYEIQKICLVKPQYRKYFDGDETSLRFFEKVSKMKSGKQKD